MFAKWMLQCILHTVLALSLFASSAVSYPVATEPPVTEQAHSSSAAEDEVKVISVVHYEPRNDFPAAMSKKKPIAAPEDPTTKVPSMLTLTY